MISKGTPGKYKDVMYFNSTQNYTLALLNAFNGVQSYITKPKEKSFTVPISFGNYEKSLMIEDLNEDDITKLNFNFLPRLVISFEGLTKAPTRQTQKYQRISGAGECEKIQFSYNSLSYDFNYRLLLQARGLTSATQITETILAKFNPSLNLDIDEFPLLGTTETQIQISDPEFEILNEFTKEEVNIINVSFDITVRGNIYSPIGLSGKLESIGIYMNIWDKKRISDAKLASYWKIDANGYTQRTFDATGRGSMPGRPEPVITGPEKELITKRKDYQPPEYTQKDEDEI